MDYIHRENLAHYRRLLAEPHVTLDQVRHREILRLLATELAKGETATGRVRGDVLAGR